MFYNFSIVCLELIGGFVSQIISPCNGLARCRRHPTGCAKILFTAREEWEMRNKRKAQRKRLWHMVLESYRIQAKWGLDPIPRQYHLKAVLVLEALLGQEELFRRIDVLNKTSEVSQGAS